MKCSSGLCKSALLAFLAFGTALFGWSQNQAPGAAAQQQSPRVVELKASDGVALKASYFAAATPGPGVLLLHQANRTRSSWNSLAPQLAAAGIHTLTLDLRGFGESGGPRADRKTDTADIETAFQYLISQPGVTRDDIGVAGAGALGVDHGQYARRALYLHGQRE